jgi:tyrosine-protein kinase Etk/Wzc
MTTTEQPRLGTETESPWLAEPEPPRRIAIFDLVLVVVRQKRLVIGVTLGFAVIVAIYALLTPKMYQSEVLLLPPQEQASRGMGGSIQDLSSALASSEGVTFKSSEDFWTSVLKGRTIGDLVVKNLNLQQVYKKKLASSARETLVSRTSFDVDRAGLIGVSVRDPDPKRAAAIANSYVSSMHEVMANMALTDAAQRKLFFKDEVQKEKDALTQAEFALEETEKKTGVIVLGGQASAAIGQISSLRGRIAAANIELQSLLTAATDQNPDVQRLRREIAADQEELTKLQTDQTGKSGIGDIGPTAVPQATLEYIRATREVRYHEALFEALMKQLEAAEMDEARSAPLVQVIDPAIPADRPSGLPRTLLVIIGGILGFFFGVMAAVLRQAWRNIKASPDGRGKMDTLRSALRGQG